jgi:opine dehydrogenase
MAALLARKGYSVRLWNRPEPEEERRWLDPIRETGALEIVEGGSGRFPIDLVTTDLAEAVDGAPEIFVVVTSDAQRTVAREAAPHLRSGQVVLLVPGRTGGALEFRAGLNEAGAGEGILVAEVISNIVNSFQVGPAQVRTTPEKRNLPVAALPASDTPRVLEQLADFSLVAAPDVLSTSLTNFGPTNHVSVMVMNAGWAEHEAEAFLWYKQGVSRSVANVIQAMDDERLRLAEVFGAETMSLSTYLVNALGAPPGDLYTSLRGCEFYGNLRSPASASVDHRFLWEDTMTGVAPTVALARAVGLHMPVYESLLALASAMMQRDFLAEGRNIDRLGLAGLDRDGILRAVRG